MISNVCPLFVYVLRVYVFSIFAQCQLVLYISKLCLVICTQKKVVVEVVGVSSVPLSFNDNPYQNPFLVWSWPLCYNKKRNNPESHFSGL